MRRRFLPPVISILLLFSTYSHAQLWSGILAPSRAIDWSQAGIPGGLPDASWAQCGSTISAYGTAASPGSASTINAQISGCAANTYVKLGAGTFYLTGSINLKNQVVVRGSGANLTYIVAESEGSGNCNGQYTVINLCGSLSYQGGPQNTATWTAGFSQGTTQITLSNSLNITAGRTAIILDQQDQPNDTGNIFVCAQSSCGSNGSGSARTSGTCASSVSPKVGFCSQQQQVLVTACSPSCNNSGSTVVTISPGLYAANWKSSNSTGAWWATTTAYQMGVEDISIDMSNVGGTSAVVLMNSYECWVSGIRSINAARNHVFLWSASRSIVWDSYFYGATSHQAESYGIELFAGSSDNLIENNIFQQVTDSTPNNNGGGAGNVAGYNFGLDDIFAGSNWFQPSDYEHATGQLYFLREGNDSLGLIADQTHGTHNLTTAFRNRFVGWQVAGCNTGGLNACAANTTAVNLFAASRYFNIVGNVLGQASYFTNYTDTYPSGSQNSSIYYLSGGGNGTWCANAACSSTQSGLDILTTNSLMRWGNYDTVSAAVRFVDTEVPSSFGDTTGTPSAYANPVPSGTTLPNSFFLTATKAASCGTGLSWWKNPALGTCPPFPAIGPDVTGGDMGVCAGGTYANSYNTAASSTPCSTGGGTLVTAYGGHANANPAMVCYLSVMNGPPDGTGGVLPFNRASCYANDPSSSDPPPAAPTGLTAQVSP